MKHETISRSESVDDYYQVVTWLNPRWRVIECPAGIQWILQYRSSAETYATSRWTVARPPKRCAAVAENMRAKSTRLRQ
jgi:hypothetical protein